MFAIIPDADLPKMNELELARYHDYLFECALITDYPAELKLIREIGKKVAAQRSIEIRRFKSYCENRRV